MRIGIAGPVSLRLLRGFENESRLPIGYEHPPMSALVNAFLDRGHDVTVFTTSVGLTEPVVYAASGLRVCIARRERRAARDLFRSERKDLVSLMKEYPTDIVNAHWSYEFAWAALDSGIPTLVTLRDHARTVFKYRRNSYKFFRLLMNYYVLSRATFLSTNSPYLFQRLNRRHRLKAKVIHNFFPKEIAVLQTPYRDRNNNVISIANGFGRLKNIEPALKAFSLVRGTLPNAKYLLIGHDMEPGGAAERYARRAGLADGIEFLGRRPHGQVLELLRRARLLLHPSLEESFGMSVLEAMIVGTPVIAGLHSGNIPSLLDHGRAGILCDVRNPRRIATKIEGLFQDEEKARDLAERARGHAAACYSEDAVVAKYIEYYRDILEKSTIGRC